MDTIQNSFGFFFRENPTCSLGFSPGQRASGLPSSMQTFTRRGLLRLELRGFFSSSCCGLVVRQTCTAMPLVISGVPAYYISNENVAAEVFKYLLVGLRENRIPAGKQMTV